jgi:hypothetical protein
MIISTFLDDKNQTRLALLQQAFLAETEAVMRMLDMNMPRSRKINGALETYLCSVWTDKNRKVAWQQGFSRILFITPVRLMAAISSAYDVWQDPEFALTVTGLDHAFLSLVVHI